MIAFMRRLLVNAGLSLRAAVGYLFRLVFGKEKRCQKNVPGSDAQPHREHLLGGSDLGSDLEQKGSGRALDEGNGAHQHAEPLAFPGSAGMRNEKGAGSSDGAAGSRNAAGRQQPGASSSRAERAGGGVDQGGPAAPPPADSEPVDMGYLQGLLDHELGPPKFSVPKAEVGAGGAPAMGTIQHEDSLKALLDREFGPPKFAVPRPTQKGKALAAVQQQLQVDAGPPTASGNSDPSMQSNAAGTAMQSRRQGADRALLHLSVIAGPAAGQSFEPADGLAEIVIGRLPASTMAIVDQEVSGRHALIEYDASQDHWTVTDVGSLNGSVLNGAIISTTDRQPGEQHVLSDQDVLELGGTTKMRVATRPPDGPPSKRMAAGNTWGPGSVAPAARAQFQTAAKLPPLLHREEFPSLGLRLAVHQRVGTDHVRTNTAIEDVVHYACPYEPFGPRTALLCVFDGHHGSQAANKAKALLPGILAAKLQAGAGGAGGMAGAPLLGGRAPERQQRLLHEVFLETDAQVASDEGCTATVVLMEQQAGAAGSQLSVQAANVGDSSCLLVNTSSGAWSKLTDDHRIANNGAERQRLQARGHTVKRRLYGLNISRMLGDKFLKDEDLGFIAEPHVSTVEALGVAQHGFVIVASDGLWDVLTEERAAALVLKAYTEDADSTTAEFVADMLLSQAITLRSQDDITILVVERTAAAAGAAQPVG